MTELSESEPRFAGLLADSHPARDVVRNLYRLSRLAIRAASTNTDHRTRHGGAMVEFGRWGARCGTPRTRKSSSKFGGDGSGRRLLVLDVRDEPAGPIDALVRSETLRISAVIGVAFRHDVLRQWAIGASRRGRDPYSRSYPSTSLRQRSWHGASNWPHVRPGARSQW